MPFASRSHSRKPRLLLPALALASLTACATVPSSPPPSACPAVVQYSVEFQNRLADELEGLPDEYTAIPQALIDYKRERDELRQCQ